MKKTVIIALNGVTVAILAVLVCVLAFATSGCRAFYTNTGSKTVVGDVSAPIEVSDAADSVTCKLLYSMTGASVWTAKDSVVTITYSNNYTNEYIGCIEKIGTQALNVQIIPCAYTNSTNCVE